MSRWLLLIAIGVFALGTVGLACGGVDEDDASVTAEATLPEEQGEPPDSETEPDGGGDGDDTTGDDGTGGGADSQLTDTGDGDDTAGDDGTSGGDNTLNDTNTDS
jgi:hypothetical protein